MDEIVHHRGYLESCPPAASQFTIARKSPTHTYSAWNTWCTPPGTAGTHTQTLFASKRIEAYGITLCLGLNDPRASPVRVPHAPAVYPIGAAYSTTYPPIHT
jgi:hypothetical protein